MFIFMKTWCGHQYRVWHNLPPLAEIGIRWLSKLGVDTSPRPHAHRCACIISNRAFKTKSVPDYGSLWAQIWNWPIINFPNIEPVPHHCMLFALQTWDVNSLLSLFIVVCIWKALCRLLWACLDNMVSVTSAVDLWGQGLTGSRFLRKNKRIFFLYDFHWLSNGLHKFAFLNCFGPIIGSICPTMKFWGHFIQFIMDVLDFISPFTFASTISLRGFDL